MFKELVGRKYSKLTIVEILRSDPSKRGRIFIVALCKCDCGNVKTILKSHVLTGRSKSCGCGQRESISRIGKLNKKRETRRTSEYYAWVSMRARCLNENHKAFKNYGGRGITICDRWIESYENFLDDMGMKGSSDLSIDRRDNDGNYEPGNCRWALHEQQANNRRKPKNSHYIEFNGKKLTVADWSRELGININTLRVRLHRGMPTEKALKI